MAIDTYYDVYNVNAYQKRVENIENSIKELQSGQFYTNAISEVQSQIRILKEKEKKIFSALGVNNIQQLNVQLEEYKKAVLNLSGAGLNQAFIAILKEKNQEEYEAFNNAVISVINEEIFYGGTIVEWGKKRGRQMILQALNDGLERYGKTKFSAGAGIEDYEIFPASFTQEQKKRWRELLKTRYKKNPKAQKYIDIQSSSSKNKMNFTFTWSGITDDLTATEAKERFTEVEIKNINNQMKELILSKVNDDKELVGKIIDHIISKNDTVFFVGKNTNDIIGTLGEIQGLYYLSKFLGGNLTKALSWRGGTFEGGKGKKPHQDILLNGLGIQVKNTINDTLGRVDFTENNIDTFLDKINLSIDAKNVFINFYGTKTFNVEYHVERTKRGRKYVGGLNLKAKNAKRFRDLREKLLTFESDIDKLLSLFGATYMYLDVAKKGKKLDANTLFLLGGVAFQTASQILSDILEDLKSEQARFKVQINTKQNRNIIDALNYKATDADYSQMLVQDIKLTSSYLFKI